MFSLSVLRRAGMTIIITFVAAAVACLSLSLIPLFAQVDNGRINIASYIIASLFWGGFLISFIASCFTKKTLCKYQEHLISKGYVIERQRIGIVSFSRDHRMYIVYGTTIIGVLLMVSDIIVQYAPEAVMFPIVSITLLSFATHCIIDGKNYKAYKKIKEIINDETKRKA